MSKVSESVYSEDSDPDLVNLDQDPKLCNIYLYFFIECTMFSEHRRGLFFFYIELYSRYIGKVL